jgi:hypothetical protein
MLMSVKLMVIQLELKWHWLQIGVSYLFKVYIKHMIHFNILA